METHYLRFPEGDWPGCLNCEATAPPAVWTNLVVARDRFEARCDRVAAPDYRSGEHRRDG